MARPIGIDLFAGAGGLSLGFEQAGFDVVAAVEIDPVHCAVHKFNFPSCVVFPRSISDLTGAEIRAKAGLGRRRIDVVFGGAPCQGFSMIGQRALDDPRNGLVRDFLRIVAELRPAYFVFENVRGLTLGEHRLFLEELIEAFSAAGYRVRLPWRVFDVADYGVPQHRERLILMGARLGEPLPDYPPALFRSADSATIAICLWDPPAGTLWAICPVWNSTRTSLGVTRFLPMPSGCRANMPKSCVVSGMLPGITAIVASGTVECSRRALELFTRRFPNDVSRRRDPAKSSRSRGSIGSRRMV